MLVHQVQIIENRGISLNGTDHRGRYRQGVPYQSRSAPFVIPQKGDTVFLDTRPAEAVATGVMTDMQVVQAHNLQEGHVLVDGSQVHVKSLVNPVEDTDAVPKSYVDELESRLIKLIGKTGRSLKQSWMV